MWQVPRGKALPSVEWAEGFLEQRWGQVKLGEKTFTTNQKGSINNFVLMKRVYFHILPPSCLLNQCLKMGLRKLHRALQYGLRRGERAKCIAAVFFLLKNMVAVTEGKLKRWKGFGRKHESGVPMSPLASKRSPFKRQHTSFGKANVSRPNLEASALPGAKSWPDGALGNGGPKTTWLHRVLARA